MKPERPITIKMAGSNESFAFNPPDDLWSDMLAFCEVSGQSMEVLINRALQEYFKDDAAARRRGTWVLVDDRPHGPLNTENPIDMALLDLAHGRENPEAIRRGFTPQFADAYERAVVAFRGRVKPYTPEGSKT